MLKVELFKQHLGMEDIFLIDVHIHHVIQRLHIVRHKVLNRINLMVDKVLHTVNVAGKTAHAIINGYDIGLKLVDQVIQRLQRRNHAAGRDFNIGAEGQALVAGLACAACMFKLGGKIPDGWLIFISLVASLAAGIAWAVIPAIFKAFWNTNETLFTLMMNYVATQLVLYCVKVWVTNGSGTLPPMADGNLPQIGGGDYWLGIIFSVVLTAAMYLYLRFSKHGYEISVVGESVKTAKYIGVNVKKVIIRTLVLSGAICGMAGFLIVAGMDHTITSTTINGRGFTAVLIAWLAHLNPIAIAGMSLLVAFLSRGTKELMTRAQITNDFYAQVITGIMFFIILACDFFIRYKIVFKKKRNPENEGSDAQKGKDELSETTTAAVKEGN